ncbi:MAG: class I SAM-dependent methyltransferase [Opitutales bacterium]|jgi:SAM-dependent methyltransferase
MERDVYERMAAQETHHWWFCARREIIRSLIEKHAAQHRPLRILEAGCGTGGNLSLLSEFGGVDAFELDDEACAIARSSGIEVSKGHLPDGIPFGGQKFDLIVLLDVLEHVREDGESIAALKQHLASGGRIILTVPAFAFLWSSHDVKHHHFRRYRRLDLTGIAASAGLEVERASYFNFFLFLLIAGVRLLSIGMSNGCSNDEKLPPPWLNRILRNIFAAERHLLSRFNLPVGVSLFAILRLPGGK